LDVVKELISAYGAKVNIARKDGRSPLMAAIDNGDEEVLKTLLSFGATLNHVAEDGSSALCVAARGGKVTAIEILLNYGADVNLVTKEGDTALSIATKKGDKDIAMILLENYEEKKRCKCDIYDALVKAKQIDSSPITHLLETAIQPKDDVTVTLEVTVCNLLQNEYILHMIVCYTGNHV
jgi:hypothetical protein